MDDRLHAEALGLLRTHPAMDTARNEVQQRAETARALLDRLPDIPARVALTGLCDLVTTRTS